MVPPLDQVLVREYAPTRIRERGRLDAADELADGLS